MSPVWRNHSGTQSCSPKDIVYPSSLKDLIELVQRAAHEGTTVRAVGAGHASSDVALTDGYLIEPDNLSSVTRIDDTAAADIRASERRRRLELRLQLPRTRRRG